MNFSGVYEAVKMEYCSWDIKDINVSLALEKFSLCHILPTVGRYETIEEKNQRSIYIYFVHMVVKNSLERMNIPTLISYVVTHLA